MTRREILKYTAFLTGAAVSTPITGAFLAGCASESEGVDQPATLYFFKEAEYKWVQQLVDIILPKTDSPAASEVGVPQMIDAVVGTVYNNEDRQEYRKAFESLQSYFEEGTELSTAVARIEAKDASTGKAIQQAYLDFKQQTIAYYLSTETIGKQFLNYLPVPGPYQGCITLEEAGGKAWAL